MTDDPGEERNPHWSPDGQSLSYVLTGTSTRNGLYVIPKDQSGRWGLPRRVWEHPNDGSAPWSPDGRTLAAAWTDSVWLIPVAGGTRRAYALPVPIGGPEPGRVEWSPDGRAIYVKLTAREGLSSIWALPLTGTRPHLLVRFDDPAKPSYRRDMKTDGRRLYFTINDRQSDIYVAELHGPK